MAVNNRAEAIIVADATLVPTLTLAQHKTLLNDNILNSVVFEKDVIASETPVAGAVTIDYANKDLATVTTSVDLAISFTNLENGAVKYLEVTKAAANVISFVGALDRVNFRDYINTVETVVVYRVSNKNGNIYIEALFAPASSVWNSLTLESGWTGSVKYRVNNFTGKLELYFKCTTTINTNYIIGYLPVSFRPSGFASILVPINDLIDYTNISAKINISSINGAMQIIAVRPLPISLGSCNIEGYVELYKQLP